MNLTKKEAPSDVVAQDVVPLALNTDDKPYGRIGWAIVIGGFLGFMVWANFAPLDKGVPVSGMLSVDSNRKSVQHQQGGTVDQILVREGDTVKAGQVLVRMNDVLPKANYAAAFAQYTNLAAAQSRLLAERDGAKTIAFPDALLSAKSDPKVHDALNVQTELFASRRAALAADLAAAEENIAGLRAQLAGLKDSSESKREQAKLMKEQLDGMRDLAKDGYIARNRLLESERLYLQLMTAISDDRAMMARIERQIAEVTQRRVQRSQDYQREVGTTLADVQRERETSQARLDSARFELKNVEVKAPVDGIVMGMNVFTSGGVVPSGFRMMDIVPTGDSLTVDAEVPVNLIDKIHPGMKVELVFSAFNTNTTPHIPGKVTTLSADRFVNEHNGMPFYKLKAVVSKEGMNLISAKKLVLRPGMPVEIFVHTGERTLMNYLLKPVFDRANMSMSEE